MEKVKKEHLIWLGSAIIAMFTLNGHWPRTDLILNLEYILDNLERLLYVAIISLVIGFFFSLRKKGQEHTKHILFVASIFNILMIIGSSYNLLIN